MSRKLKYKRDEIFRWRNENYGHHYICRATVKSMDPTMQERYQQAASYLPSFPHLNIFGCDSWERQEWDVIIDIALQHRLDAWFINPWYLSDEGWEEFQRQWQQLPDPLPQIVTTTEKPFTPEESKVIHSPCVQLEVIHRVRASRSKKD